MSEEYFFPQKPSEPIDVKYYVKEATQLHKEMYSHLHTKIEDGPIKTKLHEQLIWFQQQIKYFTHSHDLEYFLQSIQWIVSNFNSDLSLTGDQRFKEITKKYH